MENSVLVSVIIPVFNTAQYLVEALDSAIHQTYEKLEIIIIDDGSTDDSGKMCDEYARIDERVVVVHQHNSGLSVARNVGLNMMTGEAVAFLDSDDAYHPDFIRIMVEALIREKTDLVICRYITHSETGNMTRNGMEKVYPSIEKGLYNREIALQALAEKRINNHVWNKLYSASLWKDICFPEGHVFEDIDTTFRILDRCERICAVEDVLCLKRIHPGSISDTFTQQNINDWILAHKHFDSFVEKNTPDVFTEEQLIKFRQEIVQNLIEFYRHYSQKKSVHNESFLNDMRKQIVEIGARIGIGEAGFRRKTFYQLICYCPWLLRTIYPAYRSVRQTVKSVVKRSSISSEYEQKPTH